MSTAVRTAPLLALAFVAACATPPAQIEPEPEPQATPKHEQPQGDRPPVLGLDLGLPERPNFVTVDVPAVHEDGTWSVHGLRSHRDDVLAEAESDRVVRISAFVQELERPPRCPDDQLCPPGKPARAWIVDDPSIRGKSLAMMVVAVEFPIPLWDEGKREDWAGEAELELVPGQAYVFEGWFRRKSPTGYAHDRGLLELFAVSPAPVGPDPTWVSPVNSPYHPRNRQAEGLPPKPAPAQLPAGLSPGDPVVKHLALTAPTSRAEGLSRVHEAESYGQPYLADYYARWLIVDQPESAMGWVALGNLYLDCGEFDAGLAVLELGLERLPDDPALHTGLGRFFFNAGKIVDAIAAYQYALTLAPDAPDALFGLGMAHAQRLDRDRAIETLTRFLEVAEGAGPDHIIRAAHDTILRMSPPI